MGRFDCTLKFLIMIKKKLIGLVLMYRLDNKQKKCMGDCS
jgi:hypothetical protein